MGCGPSALLDSTSSNASSSFTSRAPSSFLTSRFAPSSPVSKKAQKSKSKSAKSFIFNENKTKTNIVHTVTSPTNSAKITPSSIHLTSSSIGQFVSPPVPYPGSSSCNDSGRVSQPVSPIRQGVVAGNVGHSKNQSVSLSSRARAERERDRANQTQLQQNGAGNFHHPLLIVANANTNANTNTNSGTGAKTSTNQLSLPEHSPTSSQTSASRSSQRRNRSPSHPHLTPSSAQTNTNISLANNPFMRYQHSGTILGKGHFARVSLAYDNYSHHKVAIKIIDKKDLNKNKAIVESEIALLKKLGQYRHLVSLLDHYEDDKHYYLVMDLCCGGDLFSAIVDHGKYSEHEASKCCRQIALGLQYMHDCNITHRDLKPENILLVSDELGIEGDLKLADFGLSRIMPVDTMMSTVCGTWAYCAPEVIGHQSYNKSVDLWTLGVLMFILLCGYHPFDCYGDLAEPELLQKILAVQYEFDDPCWDNVSPQAKTLIRSLIVLDPSKRMTLDEFLRSDWIVSEGRDSSGHDTRTNVDLTLIPHRLAKLSGKHFRALVTAKIAIQRFRASISRSPRTPGSRINTFEGSRLEIDHQYIDGLGPSGSPTNDFYGNHRDMVASANGQERGGDSNANTDNEADSDNDSDNETHTRAGTRSSLSSLPFLTQRLDKSGTPKTNGSPTLAVGKIPTARISEEGSGGGRESDELDIEGV